uniref:Zinc finger CCHC domain-containing protein 8 n=1 Tax=Callorhinchus milii TaxID=7868 RepID=A0A4W3HC23_CALMI|eukprot:gi/632968212/ref/XP_007900403.1/ PREDICTED: zinc finger CCHC domain-containing protein 8 [Callorhinchus milii]
MYLLPILKISLTVSLHQELRRKLNLLTQPRIVVSDSKLDGPLVQVLFMNNNISKRYHQEIEDFITGLREKYEKENQSDLEKSSFNVKPQPSSVVLTEQRKADTLNTIKKTKDVFYVVGSVQYFTNFCLDKLGQPLLNENPQLTDGWEIPKYEQIFAQAVSLDGQEVGLKAKRPKACCFNCGSTEHQLKDCPKPRDLARISEKRKEFMTMVSDSPHPNSQHRYHEEKFDKFKPGVISDELKDALGMTDENLPPFIYRMRQLGYPPGWLEEAELETSGLALYDGKDSSDGEVQDNEQHPKTHQPAYDTSKLIDYIGFNVILPKGIQDEWRLYGSIPIQSHHLKEQFASHLAACFPKTVLISNKRGSDCDRSPQHVKKRKSNELVSNASTFDMDIDSGSDTPRPRNHVPSLPPNHQLRSTPPPLPKGTPPATPPSFIPPPPLTPTPPPLPKDTPPSTPNYSPAGCSQGKGHFSSIPRIVDEALNEDGLSLEELEEQQRLIWAELEQAESINSEVEAPSDSPLTRNSAGSSLALNPPDIPMEFEESGGKTGIIGNKTKSPSAEASLVDSRDEPVSVMESTTLQQEESQKPETVEAEMHCNSGTEEEPALKPATGTTNGGNQVCLEEATDDGVPGSAVSKAQAEHRVSSVPDIGKFATGITPFEYDNLSESTGTYLKLRSLLKNSPRNQMKKK